MTTYWIVVCLEILSLELDLVRVRVGYCSPPTYTGICRHVCSVATQKYPVTTEQDIDGPFRNSLNCQTSRFR
jgi:hypothetical protein